MPPSPRRPTVLVVEDDADVRALYRHALTAAGYIVWAVEDGIDALRRIDAEAPDLIVLDLMLPRLSGRDVQREIASHANTKDIPILVVSGDTRDLNLSDFACVLRKPVNLDELLAEVAACLLRHPRRNP